MQFNEIQVLKEPTLWNNAFVLLDIQAYHAMNALLDTREV
jgi:hypothetical protein